MAQATAMAMVLVTVSVAGVRVVDALFTSGSFGGAGLAEAPVALVGAFVYDTYPKDVADDVSAGAAPEDQGAWLRFRSVSGPPPSALLVYNDAGADSTELFEGVLDGSVSCAQFVGGALFSVPVLSPAGGDSGDGTIVRIVWQETRPRAWFVYLAQCPEDAINFQTLTEVPFTYEVEMTNPGGLFQHHFSKDAQGVLETYITFVALNLCLFVTLLWLGCGTSNAHSLTSAFRTVTVLVGCEMLGLAGLVTHNVVFAEDGVGLPVVNAASEMVHRLQNVMLMLLLVVMMKGWSTTYSGVKKRVQQLSIVFGVLLAAGYSLIVVWEELGGRATSALFLFESPPGIAIICTRMAVMLWFIWSSHVRIKKASYDKRKQRFFVGFAALGLAFFISLPVSVIVSFSLKPWVKTKVVVGLDVTVNFLALVLTSRVLRPSTLDDLFNAMQRIEVGASPSKTQQTPGRVQPAPDGASGGKQGSVATMRGVLFTVKSFLSFRSSARGGWAAANAAANGADGASGGGAADSGKNGAGVGDDAMGSGSVAPYGSFVSTGEHTPAKSGSARSVGSGQGQSARRRGEHDGRRDGRRSGGGDDSGDDDRDVGAVDDVKQVEAPEYDSPAALSRDARDTRAGPLASPPTAGRLLTDPLGNASGSPSIAPRGLGSSPLGAGLGGGNHGGGGAGSGVGAPLRTGRLDLTPARSIHGGVSSLPPIRTPQRVTSRFDM